MANIALLIIVTIITIISVNTHLINCHNSTSIKNSTLLKHFHQSQSYPQIIRRQNSHSNLSTPLSTRFYTIIFTHSNLSWQPPWQLILIFFILFLLHSVITLSKPPLKHFTPALFFFIVLTYLPLSQTACSSNCQNCSPDGNTCNSCPPRYFPNRATCNICGTNCYACNSLSDCLTCLTFLNSHGQIGSNYFNTGAGNCVLCSINCLSCLNQTTCATCQQGYGINLTTFKCQTCTTNCLICSNISTCDQCNTGYGINPNNMLDCILCNSTDTLCLNCTMFGTCLQCSNHGYLLTSAIDAFCMPCNQTLTNCLICAINNSLMICIQCMDQISFINSTTQTCQLCSTIFPYCHICNRNIQCLTCNIGFYMGNYHKCYCIVGQPITGVCIDNWGCIAAQMVNNVPTCVNCDQNMILSAGKCVCIQGWIVTGICTNIVGCFVMQKASGINQCVKCIGDEFHLKNGICHCYVGYELVGSHCQSICGDGLIFTEACDDGNNISGDGCSSICQVQSGYTCNNNIEPSECVYQLTFVLKLQNTQRVNNANVAIFIFSITPAIDNLKNMDFGKYVEFQCNQTNIIMSVNYKNGLITIPLSFSQSLQGNSAILSLTFDPKITLSTINYPFTMLGNNMPLTILNPQLDHILQLLNSIIYPFSLFILTLFALSSCFHKMIGVQLITVAQTLFFMLELIDNYSVTLSSFTALQCVNVCRNVLKFTDNIVERTLEFSRIGFIKSFTANNLLLLCAQGIAFVIFAIFFLRKYVYLMIIRFNAPKIQTEEDKETQEATLTKYETHIAYCYKIAIFPMFMGFLFQTLLATKANFQHSTDQLSTSRQNAIISFFTLIITVTIFTWQSFTFLNFKKLTHTMFQLQHAAQGYPWMHCLYSIVFAYLIICSTFVSRKICLVLTCSWIVAYQIYLVVKRPYELAFNNIVIIFGQSIVLIFAVILSVDSLTTGLTDQTMLYTLLVLTSLLIIFTGLTIVRILLVIKKLIEIWKLVPVTTEQQKIKWTKNIKQKTMFWRGEAIEESMKQMNPYFYEVMEANQRYEKFKETNNDRLKAGLQPLPFTMNDTILSKAPLEKFLSNQNGIDKSFSGQSFLKSIKKLIKKQQKIND